MCRFDDREIRALDFVKRAHVVLKRHKPPSEDCLVLIERWLSRAEAEVKQEDERELLELQRNTSRTLTLDERVTALEKKVGPQPQ